MPKITYRTHAGTEHQVEVPVGQSVMQGAVNNGIPGIDADCGGQCACATCHVYVDEHWLAKVGTAGPQEEGLLAAANDVRTSSRLSCQIAVTEDLDGLVVGLPRSQH